MMHHWLAKRGLFPVNFSSSEVNLFVNCNVRDDLPFFERAYRPTINTLLNKKVEKGKATIFYVNDS